MDHREVRRHLELLGFPSSEKRCTVYTQRSGYVGRIQLIWFEDAPFMLRIDSAGYYKPRFVPWHAVDTITEHEDG